MNIFNSPWLISMLAKSSKTPQGRILSLFDILNDWLNAPHFVQELNNEDKDNHQLVVFCTEQAKAMGAENPMTLAELIVIIAKNATTQEINQPGCGSLIHAKKAANAIILAQTQPKWPLSKPILSGIAASILLIMAAIPTTLPILLQYNRQEISLAKIQHGNYPSSLNVSHQSSPKLTAQDAASMYSKYEQMRNGTCQFPEVIQIPDKDKAIYLENVVGGKLPTNLDDLAIANSYFEKVRCNFTPILMANSK